MSGNFVVQVNQSHAACAENHTVEQAHAFGCQRVSLFQTAQGGAHATDAAVTDLRVVLKGHFPCEATFNAADAKTVQELAVAKTVDVELEGIFICKCPADVVMGSRRVQRPCYPRVTNTDPEVGGVGLAEDFGFVSKTPRLSRRNFLQPLHKYRCWFGLDGWKRA